MENIFLACFAFGALFTLATVVLGFGGHGIAHLGHGAPHLGHGAAHIGHGALHGGHGDAGRFDSLPLLNASSVVGALTWFGAAGYLLLRLGDWALPAVILGALLAGGIGWYLVASADLRVLEIGYLQIGEHSM